MTPRLPRLPHGRKVPTVGGYQAYLPQPLPPPLVWGGELATSLSAADLAIGRLAGAGRRLPNPHLFVRPFVRREAVLSSRIEGTRTTLGELLVVEAGGTSEQSPADVREVANYVEALEYGVERLASLPLSLRLVSELHERLMRGVRGDVAMPGEFRRNQNWIGPRGATMAAATFVPPPPERLSECLASWEEFLHDESLPPLVHVALVHAQFEAIHPFLDGNGRVGRLLIPILLVSRGVLPSPLLYLSAYLEATRGEYYARLLGITERGEWEEWLHYFLTGVASQADDALSRVGRIDDLVEAWRHRLPRTSSRVPAAALDLFVESPFWTLRALASRLDVAFTTAQRGVERLESAGIVTRLGMARRNRVYCAREMLAILDEAPRLT